MRQNVTGIDYEALSEFRYQIRRFLHFSEQECRAAGVEPQQQQLLLAVKALSRKTPPRIADLAERLQIEHHSAVELANRLASTDFIRRHRGGKDRRVVLIELTREGERLLRRLSLHHRAELRRRGPALIAALKLAISTRSHESRSAKKSPAARAVKARRRKGMQDGSK